MAELPTITLDIDRRGADQKIAGIKKGIRELTSSVGALNTAVVDLNRNLNKAIVKSRKLGGVGGTAGGGGAGGIGAGLAGGLAARGGRGSARSLTIPIRNVKDQALGLANASNQSTDALTRLKSSMGETAKTAQLLEGPLGGTAARLVTLDAVAKSGKLTMVSLLGTTAALGVGFALSVSRAAQFERQMVEVEKTTGMTGSTLEKFGERLTEMAVDTGIGQDQLANIAAVAGRLGVRGSNNLAKFTRTIAQMTRTTDLSAEQAAINLSRMLNVTGESVSNVDRLGSAIATVGDDAAALDSEIVNLSGRLVRVLGRFEITTKEVVGLAGAMKELGITSEAGATQIGKTIETIADSIANGGKELRILSETTGIAGTQLRRAFDKNALNAILMVVDAMGDVPAAQLAPELERLGLNGQRITQTLGPMADRIDLVRQKLGLSAKAWRENTKLQTDMQRELDTFLAQFDRLGRAFTDIGERIGSTALPAGTDFLRWLADTVDGIDDATDSLDSMFKTFSKGMSDFAKDAKESNFGKGIQGLIDDAKQIGSFVADSFTLSPFITAFNGASNAVEKLSGIELPKLRRQMDKTIERVKVFADSFKLLSRRDAGSAMAFGERVTGRADIAFQIENARRKAQAFATGGDEAFRRVQEQIRLAKEETRFFSNALEILGSENIDQVRNLTKEFMAQQRFISEMHRLEERRMDTSRLITDIKSDLTQAEKTLRKETEKTAETSKEVGQALETAFQNAIFNSKSFSDVLDALSKKLLSIMAFGPRGGGGLFGGIFQDAVGLLGGSSGGSSPSVSQLTAPLKFLADGGRARRNEPHIVGERGPELFVPGKGGTVVPNDSAGSGMTVTQEINIQTGLPAQAAAEARSAGKQAAMEALGELEAMKQGVV